MLLNKKATKAFIKKRLKEQRQGWEVTQVSDDTYQLLDMKLREIIDDMVHRHPTIGKTFKASNVLILK